MSSPTLILLVEDDAAGRSVLEEGLQNNGYDVVVSSGGKRAMIMLDHSATTYDLLIMNVDLEGPASGWEVATHARSRNPKLPVLYMTAAAHNDFILKSVPDSALLLRPFALSQLTAAVSDLIKP